MDRAGDRLEMIYRKYGDCTRCSLHHSRQRIVFGEGNPHSPLLFVGEGPGVDEDRQGRPFVGRAGRLLDKMLAAAEIVREEIYISNIVKCRPPGNRTPTPEEMNVCIAILREQYAAMRPKVLVTLGSAPTRAILHPRAKITQVRGKWFKRKGLFILPTFHPAFLLRNPESKREAWEDFQKIRDVYQKIRAQQPEEPTAL